MTNASNGDERCQTVAKALQASCNVLTAALQLEDICEGRPELEQLARDLANTASVIDILAYAILDGEL